MIFTPTKPEKLLEQQMRDAKRIHLEHAAAAEYHAAIAKMAADRLVRLNQLQKAQQ